MNYEPRTTNRLLALCTIGALALSIPAAAEIPPLIRYQGQAVDKKGVPLEGPYTLTFRLYDAETAGTKVWEEVQPNVPLAGGHFSVLLGQGTSLASMDWGKPCWLSIQVNTDPELSPRQRITSVPLAIRAGMAETAATAALAQKAERLTVPVTTSTITDDANGLVPAGAIILWDGSTCPAGYTRASALDGKFLVAGATSNAAAGGSNTKDLSHAHGAGSYVIPAHSHTFATSGTSTNVNTADPRRRAGISGGFVYGNEGTETPPSLTDHTQTDGSGGAITGTSASGGSTSLDIRPAFATILLCKKN